MEVVTLREFSRRVGVSLTAVQKGVKTGRIVAITDDTGKITGIDYASQGEAWTANSKHPQKKPHTSAGGRPRNDGLPPAAPRQQPQEGEVVEHLEAQPHGGALKRNEKTPAPPGQMTMAEVQRARELVKLQIDNLKLKEAQGELVSAAEVRKQGHALASGIISHLYNIPDRCADEIAGMSDPHAIHKLLLAEIDNAVEAIRKAYA
jgi:hypothetical protein